MSSTSVLWKASVDNSHNSHSDPTAQLCEFCVTRDVRGKEKPATASDPSGTRSEAPRAVVAYRARLARNALRTALRLDLQMPHAWHALGVAKLGLGKCLGGLRAFITAQQLNPQSETGARYLAAAVCLLVAQGRWWIIGLLAPVAFLTSPEQLTGEVTAQLALRIGGAILIAAAAYYVLVVRLLRVFPRSMRLAASQVLREDRLVRPTRIGLAIAAAAQVVAVAIPLPHQADWFLAFLLTLAGSTAGYVVARLRLRKKAKVLQAEREAQWRTVVTSASTPSAQPGSVRPPDRTGHP
jgi:hypothetical protein